MADVAFSDLTALSTLAGNDLFCVTDVSESGGEQSKKILTTAVRDYMIVTSKPGAIVRSKFVYKDADEIYAYPGWYAVKEKLATWWTSYLTIQLSGASANTWYYLYLDYSAITSGTEITASEFVFSTTAPTWSNTYSGWYNGDDRCVFAVKTASGSSNILEFFHDGGNLVMWADQIQELSSGSASTFTDIDMASAAPGFCTKQLVYFSSNIGGGNGSYGYVYWRTNGQSGTTGHIAGYHYIGDNRYVLIDNQADVISDSSQIIEYKISYTAGTNIDFDVYVDGWYLPVGM